eukprot:773845-Pyramimonas_sp.AAC.1
MLQQPLLALWSAICGQVSPRLFVTDYFEGRPPLGLFSSSLWVALELATFTLKNLVIETDQRLSRRADLSSGASGP